MENKTKHHSGRKTSRQCQEGIKISLFIYKILFQKLLIHCRPSPKRESKSSKSKSSGSTSFQDFQESVSDAWDLDDDEDFTIITGLESR